MVGQPGSPAHSIPSHIVDILLFGRYQLPLREILPNRVAAILRRVVLQHDVVCVQLDANLPAVNPGANSSLSPHHFYC